MKTITFNDVTPISRNDRYVADASAIGLNPGEWPEQLETTLGNSTALIRNGRVDGGYLYLQMKGTASLVILDDH